MIVMIGTLYSYNLIIQIINLIYSFFRFSCEFLKPKFIFHRFSVQSTFQKKYVVFLNELSTCRHKQA